MDGRIRGALVAVVLGLITVSTARAEVDVTPRPLAWIPPGTVIGDKAPSGWSHLLLLAEPRIGAGDVTAVPRMAAKYSSMFLFTIVANVRPTPTEEGQTFSLEKVAIGSALRLDDGRRVVATSSQTFGKDLGFIGRRVFQENETMLGNEVRQVARTPTMIVFDANGYVVFNQKHSRMVIRHAVVVSPKDGTLSTLVWLLGSNGQGGYALAERTLQMLPPDLHEDRVLSVDAQKFSLGIPAPDAFALVRITQGSPVRFTKALSPLAATARFTVESAQQLESVLQTSYAPLAAQVAARKTTRR